MKFNFLSLCFIFLAKNCLAHCGHLEDQNTGPARICIQSPEQDQIIRERSFTLIITVQGDPNGDLSELDHIHYEVDQVEGIAIETKLTMPDLSGEVSFSFTPETPDGEKEVCYKLARIDHSQIGEKVCNTFKYITSGFDLLSPTDNSNLSSFDVDIQLAQFGDKTIDLVYYQVNTASVKSVSNNNANFTITGLYSGLKQGENLVSIWGETSDGYQIGYTININLYIDSKLNLENAEKILQLFKKNKRSYSSTYIVKALKIIKQMLSGGSQHPEEINLNQKRLKKVQKIAKEVLMLLENDSDSDELQFLSKQLVLKTKSLL